jgi:hypothetical protein
MRTFSPRGRIGLAETVARILLREPVSSPRRHTRQDERPDGTGFTTAELLATIREFVVVRAIERLAPDVRPVRLPRTHGATTSPEEPDDAYVSLA